MQRSFFDISPVELNNLGPEPAVTVLREMLWAEARFLGLPVTDTSIPFAVTTPDGGIDAEVSVSGLGAGHGLIFPPRTSYQVKAGDFPLGPSAAGMIESLLIKPSSALRRRKARLPIKGSSYSKSDINPRIRECLDILGTFVVALFGNDSIDAVAGASANAIVEFLKDIEPAYAAAQVKVWRQSDLCGLLRQFPAVGLRIKHLAGLPLLSHEEWSLKTDMRPDFIAAPDQQAAIESIRVELRSGGAGLHIRLVGEPGVGKTRLILEALRPEDLRYLVLYAAKGSDIDGSAVAALRTTGDAFVVLVVDECAPERRSEIANSFGSTIPNLQIISIYQDPEEGDRSAAYRLVHVPVLPKVNIISILNSYGVDQHDAAIWAEFCDGSPRVAHVVGQNLQTDPTDPLKGDGISMVWTRYLAGPGDRTSTEYRHRHLVLATLALFKQFGWIEPVRSGALEIFEKIISKLDSSLSLAEFTIIIEQMFNRKILQGDYYLYITPKALQIKLWIDWWSVFGPSIDMMKVIPQLSDQLRQWFVQMIEYGAAAPVSKRLVKELLGSGGLFKEAGWLNTSEGSSFFFSLSVADPRSAIATLERTIGSATDGQLIDFKGGRRNVISALEGIAIRAELFKPAARLVLNLAEAENETWSNNATGVFAGLFSLGHGETAPTSLAPAERLPVLIEAIAQGGERASIAIRAFYQALSLNSISRFGGDQPFRLTDRVKRWQPETYGEWFEEYRRYWAALRTQLRDLPEGLAKEAVEVMLSRGRELLSVELLQEDILAVLEDFVGDSKVDQKELISTLEDILDYDATEMSDTIIGRLESIRDRLVGTSFDGRLRRYAGMSLLQDELNSEGHENHETVVQLRELASEGLANYANLESELGWLVTKEARNGYRFGQALGDCDQDETLLPALIAAWEAAAGAADSLFLGGYLGSIFRRAPARWETMIRGLVHTTQVELLPELIWRSGLTDEIGRLLLELVRTKRLLPNSLALFAVGRASSALSDAVFAEWLGLLIALQETDAAIVAINLGDMARLAGRVLAPEQLEQLINQKPLFDPNSRPANSMVVHHWLQLAKALANVDETKQISILQILLDNLGASGGIGASLANEGETFLNELVSRHPITAWKLIAKQIEPPMSLRGLKLTRWLRGDIGFHGRNPGPIKHIPLNEVWNWIEEDPKKRAPYVATMAAKDFDQLAWPQSLIRDLLVRYGDRAEVRSAVHSNFFTGGWSGPASAHYEGEREELTAIRSTELEPNALRWLDEAIEALEANREQAAIEEEARGY